MFLDEFAKLSKASHYTISAALLTITVIAIYNWVISPHTRYLSAAQKYEQVLDERSKTNKIILNNLKIKKTRLEQLKQKLANLNKLAFTEKEAKNFWSNLEQITEEAGCYFNSLTIFESKQKSGTLFTTESVSLSITGNYSGITEVIDKINSNPHKVWFDSLQLQTIQQSSVIQCDMTITIYKSINKE